MLQYLVEKPAYVNVTVVSGESADVNVIVLSGEPAYVNAIVLQCRASIRQCYRT
jgi:uncharacterized protein (UPF0297 family)